MGCTLVFIPHDYPLLQMLSIFLIQHIYWHLTRKINAFDNPAKLAFVADFALTIFFHYIQLVFFTSDGGRNIVGWLYIAAVSGRIVVSLGWAVCRKRNRVAAEQVMDE